MTTKKNSDQQYRIFHLHFLETFKKTHSADMEIVSASQFVSLETNWDTIHYLSRFSRLNLA